MKSFIKQIEKVITTILPLLLMANLIPAYIIPLLVAAPALLNICVSTLNPYLFPNDNYELNVYEADRHGEYNNFYLNISYVLETQGLIEKIKKQECDSFCFLKNDIRITPSVSEEMILLQENFSVTIKLRNKENEHAKTTDNFYHIEGKKYDDIVLFKKYISEYVSQEMEKAEKKRSKYVCVIFNDTKWTQRPINVIKSFDNIFLDKQTKQNIEKNIDEFFNNELSYVKFGIPRKLGFILYGIPGTGKSSTVFAISKKYNMKIYIVNLDCDKKKLLLQMRGIKEKSIVLFEDIDTVKLTHDRKDNSEENKDKIFNKKEIENITLGDVLEILDGYYYLKECIVIMTTNNIDKLDSALIRPGRIDHRYEYKYLTKEVIFDIMNYFYNIELDSITLNKIKCNNLTSAKLINSVILPNINNHKHVLNYLLTNDNE